MRILSERWCPKDKVFIFEFLCGELKGLLSTSPISPCRRSIIVIYDITLYNSVVLDSAVVRT